MCGVLCYDAMARILDRELNEAFATVPLHCADVLGIDHSKMNVNGGAISIGHPLRHDGLPTGAPPSTILISHFI